MNLREQQQFFLKTIFDSSCASTNENISSLIAPNERMSAQQQLDIYRDGVVGGLTTALADTYPVCFALVGEAFFNAMAMQFVFKHASTSPDLSNYSPLFCEFISTFKPAESLVYLSDVAKLEWNWHQVFHEADDSPLNFGSLAEQQDKDVTFHLVQAGRLIHSNWPVHKIWQVNQPEYIGDTAVNLDEGEVFLWLCRNGYEMRIEPLNKNEWALLKALSEPKPFSQICDALVEPAGDNIDISTLLPEFVAKGWICDFSTNG
ncbi:MAG: putative DNA-binding domain-containing protein [Pseudomonadales bacterium]|nr:putative DNA-binding domain-containing protein [Pseudomonadales bacterium]